MDSIATNPTESNAPLIAEIQSLRARIRDLECHDLERQEAEALWHLIRDQLPCVVWTADLNFRVTSSSGAGLTAFGLHAGQLVNMTLDEFHRDDPDRARYLDVHRRAALGEFVQWEVEWRGRVAQSYLQPLRDKSGTIIGVIGLSLDITDNRRLQEQLRQSERRLAEAQRVAHIGSWERDLETNQVIWSDELYRLFGLLPQDHQPPSYATFLQFILPEDRVRIEAGVAAAIREHAPFAFDYKIRLPDEKLSFTPLRSHFQPEVAELPSEAADVLTSGIRQKARSPGTTPHPAQG